MMIRDSEKSKGRNDLILLISVLAVCLLFWAFQREMGRNSDHRDVVISVDGDVVLKCSLDVFGNFDTEEELRSGAEIYDDRVLSFSEEGVEVKTAMGYNIIRYEIGGGIRCTEADCPDKVCIETGEIKDATAVIVCLPHSLTARIE